MKKFIHILCLLAAAVGIVSCRHIDLYDPSSGLYVVFDFDFDDEEETKASMNEYIGGIRILFYDPEQNYYVYDEILPPQGGFVHAEPGTYDVIAYSIGSEVVRTSGLNTRAMAYAYTEEIGASLMLTKAGENGEPDINLQFPIINMPDGFFAGRASGVYVPGVVSDEKTVRIEMDVDTFVHDWTFIANNVAGAENISIMNCYITGQLQGRYMWDKHYEHKVTAIGFNISYDPATKSITGTFNTFGKHPQALANVFLNIVVKSSSGGYYQWIYDVTEQFENPDNRFRRLVVNEAIVVPAADGGGVNPVVSDWNAEIIDIPLN